MTSRRRNSNKNLGNSISDVRRRLKYLERKPVRTKLQNRVIKAAAIAPSSITADEVDFGTALVTTDNPADVVDNPKDGLLVIDPDTNGAFIYSEDQGNYVEIQDATAQATADGKNTIYYQTTAPSSGSLKTNDIWYDTDDGNKLYVWNGTSWVNIQDTAIAAAAAAATAAQSTADGKNKVYRQDAEPSGGTYVSGDIWFDTDDNNKIYRYSGTAWVAVQLGGNALANISANSITTGTIDASVITVSSINASNISTGTLAASRIAANSLDVSVLQAGTLRAGTVYAGNITGEQITAGTITGRTLQTSASGRKVIIDGSNNYIRLDDQTGTATAFITPLTIANIGDYGVFIHSGSTVDTTGATAGAGIFIAEYATRIYAQDRASFIDMSLGNITIQADNALLAYVALDSTEVVVGELTGYAKSGDPTSEWRVRDIKATSTAGTPTGGVAGAIMLVYT
jgi:hypothetical protein